MGFNSGFKGLNLLIKFHFRPVDLIGPLPRFKIKSSILHFLVTCVKPCKFKPVFKPVPTHT